MDSVAGEVAVAVAAGTKVAGFEVQHSDVAQLKNY